MIIVLSWLDVFNKMNEIIKLDDFIYEKIIQRSILTTVFITAFVFVILSALQIIGVVILLYSIAAMILIILSKAYLSHVTVAKLKP